LDYITTLWIIVSDALIPVVYYHYNIFCDAKDLLRNQSRHFSLFASLLCLQLLEIALPVGFVCILLGIKVALEGTDGFQPQTIVAEFPTNDQTVIPLSFRDYATSLQAIRVCQPSTLTDEWDFQISGFYDNQNPFLKCDRRRCTSDGQDASEFCERLVLAVAPSSSNAARAKSRAESFQAYIETTYPDAINLAAYPLVKFFTSESELSDYVKKEAYGKDGFPKIGFGVVFGDGSSEKDYAYTLRQNSTNFNQPEQEGRPAQATTPQTKRDFEFNANTDIACVPVGGTSEQGILQESCTGQYLYNGAITMQRTVQDWIMVDSGSRDNGGVFVAEHGVQFVSFPTKEYTINGFYASINGKSAV
jgi:hypothetical protein